MLKNLIGAGVIGLGVAISSPALASTVNTVANVVFIVDESGSMGGDQDFLKNSVVDKLDTDLNAAGVTTRKYGVVGFGSSSVAPRTWGTLTSNTSDTKDNLDDLTTNGGTEDGWAAINYALSAFNYDNGAAINFILVTDEDRDNWNSNSLTYSSVLQSLKAKNILLNAVVDHDFEDGSGTKAIGIDDGGSAYLAAAGGTYTTSTGGVAGAFGFGTTKADYVDMALATGGAAWDIQLLRNSTTALSFADAFIDIKVQEITTQPPSGAIPLPAGAWLMLTGIAGLGVARRRKTKS